MDPNAALQEFLEAIEDRNESALWESGKALREWLERGGFLPTPLLSEGL